ncbi:hypothetical protein H632_c1070p1 [Helicosporidium sp. ATCC 50920]|nr:hypothetical protein H632_c1070p1 [Helicosporidium sp. ATCC 50920]|eukprot:KDD74793.1 hypothetical protein H632_c1070p1 [Helicosporidium sp. ATCC 50920]
MPASPLAPDPSPRTRLGALLHRGLRAMGEAVAAARAEAGLEAWPSTGSLASATSFQSDASRTQAQLRDADASLSAMLRERIVLGLSRRFQQRRARGLLSPRSWRALRSACALAREGLGRETHAPLSVWEHVSAQVRPGRLSRLGQRLEERLPEEGREGCCGRVREWLMVRQLRESLFTCEVALEFFLALMPTPHNMEWLYESQTVVPVALLSELQDQLQAAHDALKALDEHGAAFFDAIQTHRAHMAVLHSQKEFVHRLFVQGLLDEREEAELRQIIDEIVLATDLHGPAIAQVQ